MSHAVIALHRLPFFFFLSLSLVLLFFFSTDTIKVRLQTQSGLYKSGLDCLRQTISKEGILAVYKGMAGPMLTIPLVNAVVFAAYAHAKDFMHKLQPEPVSARWVGAGRRCEGCRLVPPLRCAHTASLRVAVFSVLCLFL